MSRIVHDGPAVYVNADRSAVVDEASPEAAFVMVGPGGEVDVEYEALYRRHFIDAEPEKPNADMPETPKPAPAPARKPRKRTTKKQAASD